MYEIDCPACDSPNVAPQGMLGRRLHCRCEDCGMWFSFIPTADHENEDTTRAEPVAT